MERALNSVKFEGFISKIEKNEILKTLPVDFAKDRYLMLYTAYDQDGNEMDASEFADAKSPKVTFIGDNPMLVRTGQISKRVEFLHLMARNIPLYRLILVCMLMQVVK